MRFNILYLNPIFLSGSTHKYDSWDHFKVDESFGGDAAFKKLIEEAHKKNMKVVIDCSLNHVHPRHFAFQDLITNGDKSEYKDWFTVYDYPVRIQHRPHLYSNTYKVGWDGNAEEYKTYLEKTFEETKVPVEIKDDDGPIIEPSYKAWWGVPDMTKVNLVNPEADACCKSDTILFKFFCSCSCVNLPFVFFSCLSNSLSLIF